MHDARAFFLAVLLLALRGSLFGRELLCAR